MTASLPLEEASTSWDPAVVQSVQTGDLARLQAQLAGFEYNSSDRVKHEQIYDLIETACKYKQVETLQWLLNNCTTGWEDPRFSSPSYPLTHGTAIYDCFLERWPELLERDLGHNGNPLGFSAFAGDKVMVEFLLNKGADPNNAHWSHRYFKDPKVFTSMDRYISDDIWRLMVAHGFKIPEGVEWPKKKPAPRSRCLVS